MLDRAIHLKHKLWPSNRIIFSYIIFIKFKLYFSRFRLLSQKLDELKEKIQNALVDRVVEDFVDITTPLKQFTEAVLAPEGEDR